MRHEKLIARMSLAEKCAMLQGATTFGSWANERLGIPSVEFSDVLYKPTFIYRPYLFE